MEVLKYESSWQERWNTFVLEAKNTSFLFNRNFLEYHSDRFEDFSLIVIENNNIVALLPANVINGVLFSHQGLTYGGLVLSYSIKLNEVVEVVKAICEYLLKQSISTIIYKAIPKMYHTLPADEMDWILFKLQASLIRRDSALVIDNLNMLEIQKRRWRSIQKASKLNYKISEAGEEGYKAFWKEILTPNLKEKHGVNPVHSLDEIMLLAKRFPNHVKQINIYVDDQIMAGCTMFINKTVAHAQYISGSIEGRNSGCLDLLFYKLIKEVCKDSRYFDFGISNENDGQVLNMGLLDWKEGFGGRAISHDFYKIEAINYQLLNNI